MNTNMTLQEGAPNSGIDLEAIHIYADGSGKASAQLNSALHGIAQEEAVLKLLRLFIYKHRDTLAGSYWRVRSWKCEIEMHPGYYRGQKAAAHDLALLWADAKWERVESEYSNRPLQRDWVTKINGVTLRIPHAETYQPSLIPANGPIDIKAPLCLGAR